jgi:cAMP-dependent protein kinase regulator
MFVKKMDIEFVVPDKKIITIFEEVTDDDFLYVIELGKCIVSISDKDKLRNKSKEVRTLVSGEIFGEVAFLYNSKRSATVTSNNYCTLGKLSRKHLNSLFDDFPFLR